MGPLQHDRGSQVLWKSALVAAHGILVATPGVFESNVSSPSFRANLGRNLAWACLRAPYDERRMARIPRAILSCQPSFS